MRKKNHVSPKKVWLEKPFRLTVGEMKNPLSVLKGFFNIYDLVNVNDHIGKLLNSFPDADPELLDTIEFTQDLEKLIEANHFLLKKSTKKTRTSQ
ncbi:MULTISPECIES: hypothetical protein [unclassified Chitinophaga]|uniref:hypothetical protein n=1 Tax=unclassified Chitinophaga TaxID=2619133 RepID=UPI0030104BB9